MRVDLELVWLNGEFLKNLIRKIFLSTDRAERRTSGFEENKRLEELELGRVWWSIEVSFTSKHCN